MRTKLTLVVAAVAVLTLSSLQPANAQSWAIGGNTVSKDTTLGTKNAFALKFITSNIERMRITALADVGIGTTAPASRLEVSRGTGLSNIARFTNTYTGSVGDRSTIVEMKNGNGTTWRYAVGGTNNSLGINSSQLYFTTSTATAAYLAIATNGNVGIGTAAPVAKTQIYHNSTVTNPQLLLYENQADYARLTFQNSSSTSFWTIAGFNSTTNAAERLNFYNSTVGDILSITGNGQVVIGNSVPATGYKLSVRGRVICEEVNVALQASWPDYVFGKDYKLMNLKDLDAYIKTNNHLPDIAPADKMEKQGVAVGETQRLLMQKIEELTLYMIEQSKQIQQLQQQIQQLEKK